MPTEQNPEQTPEIKHNQKEIEDKILFSWISKDDLPSQRGMIWNIIMILFVLAFTIWGIIYEAWTFSLVIVVFAIVYYIVQKNSPIEIEVIISEKGIRIGKIFYDYQRISGFKVRFNPPISNNLVIVLKKNILSEIRVNLGETPSEELKGALIKKLPELKVKNESITDYFKQIFKI